MRAITALLAATLLAGCAGVEVDPPADEPDQAVEEPAEETEPDPPVEEPEPEPEPEPAPPETSLTLEGEGEWSSDSFVLDPGDYVATWTKAEDCFHGFWLMPLDDSGRLVGLGSSDEGASSGSNNVYGVRGGRWYLDVNTGAPPGCPWTFTLEPAAEGLDQALDEPEPEPDGEIAADTGELEVLKAATATEAGFLALAAQLGTGQCDSSALEAKLEEFIAAADPFLSEGIYRERAALLGAACEFGDGDLARDIVDSLEDQMDSDIS